MTTFEALSARRRSYIVAARDNGFEDGLRTLLADLYPDNAHFIYELLQNAEDAGAKEVTFDLRLDGLKVEHNGTRLFSLRDIDSITGIGQTTKSDEATSIGKFGVGFKAVFAYTQNPEIHSGDYSFSIKDLFVPVPIPSENRADKTTFWFPFDRSDKPAERAINEIAKGLREIQPTTLLFLDSIQMIGWYLPDGDERLLERSRIDDNVIEINSVNDSDESSCWYRVSSQVVVDGEEFPIAAAFALESNTADQQQNMRFKVVPVDGQVFIYFPAVKETSGLRFHIHAPFASTVARDSLRDDPANDVLVDGIADLLADSLLGMRDHGLMTDGLLTTLPNLKDELPLRYAIVHEKILAGFSVEPVTPMIGGKHAPSTELVRTDAHIRSALSIDDAKFLLEISDDIGVKTPTGWLPTREGRARDFLDSLVTWQLDRDAIAAKLDLVVDAYNWFTPPWSDDAELDEEYTEELDSWDLWLRQQSDDWMRSFYGMLGESSPSNGAQRYRIDTSGIRYLETIRMAPLIRVQNGNGIRHVPAGEAYLPSTPGLRAENLVIDSLTMFDVADDGEKKASTRRLRNFYEHVEIESWNATAQLNARLNDYQEPAATSAEHLADLNTLSQLLEQGAVPASAFSGRRLLVGLRQDGSRFWASPNELFLDEPFVSTGLASLYESDQYPALSAANPFYPRPARLDPEYLNSGVDVAALVGKLGAIDRLQIKKVRVKDNPKFDWRWDVNERNTKVDSDWQIPHLDLILTVGDEALLSDLWRLISTGAHTYAEAKYRNNNAGSLHEMSSQLLLTLQTRPWILDRDGNLRLARDSTAHDLPEDCHLPENAPLLDILSFGVSALVDKQRQRKRAEAVRELGLDSFDEIERMIEAHKRSPERLKAMLDELESEPKLPNAATVVPEMRAKRAAESSSDAPEKRYEKRIRSVSAAEPGLSSASRAYLQAHYTNDDQIMVCQICNRSMPFKINGAYYFEAVQFVKDANRDLLENRLALCPTCAAKYRHARGTTLADLRDDLLTQEVGIQGHLSVEVVLAGTQAKVRFVGKHAIDLQAALAATMGDPLNEEESH